MANRKNKINGKVDLMEWQLPKSIDHAAWDELDKMSSSIEKIIERTRDKAFDFERMVKKAAAEALQYSIEDDASISFCRQKDPKTITVGFPLGKMEGYNVEWSINFFEEIRIFASFHTFGAATDEEKGKKFLGFISMLRESADYLETRYNKIKKETEEK